MPEPEVELLQSLETVLEESRRLRAQSTVLLENAQWPVLGPAPREESSLPIPDLLRVPVPPLLGFQRDKGNLPVRQPAQLLEPALTTVASPAPSLSEAGEALAEVGVLEPAGAV